MIKTIDLFAGAGGLSYGFCMTGKFQFVAAAEINKNARKTYEQNIANKTAEFEFIENVIGYDFNALNARIGDKIDVVIGGPPCQGFSNANRQKNHLISMNNGLIKEFFRAIRQIKPKVFVMENVSMLESDTHRFYESEIDNDEINRLIECGYDIPKREDCILLSKQTFDGIEMEHICDMDMSKFVIPKQLSHLLSVLKKNIGNSRRLPKFLKKNSISIKKLVEAYGKEFANGDSELQRNIFDKLCLISDASEQGHPEWSIEALNYVVGLQKLIEDVQEIESNELIGRYDYSMEGGLRFIVNSYSVIDYVNAILGDDYKQWGNTINAEWFGVPQERRRYIVVGIRSDVYDNTSVELKFPTASKDFIPISVGEAIADLTPYQAGYEVGYEVEYTSIPNFKQKNLSEYAVQMREGSAVLKNHLTTRTTDKALARFKKIKQGKIFHSLSIKDKDTYSNPERTQNTIYLRLDPQKPSGTVVNVRKSMWIHPTLDRAITVREAARLQSFPDVFEFVGSKDSQYQQVGNAVPPLLAKSIAEMILQYLQ